MVLGDGPWTSENSHSDYAAHISSCFVSFSFSFRIYLFGLIFFLASSFHFFFLSASMVALSLTHPTLESPLISEITSS